MLRWVVIFLVLAVISGMLGFVGVAFISVKIAKMIFGLFLFLFIVSLIMHLVNGKGSANLP